MHRLGPGATMPQERSGALAAQFVEGWNPEHIGADALLTHTSPAKAGIQLSDVAN
jgi:hypothetical protein